MSLNTHHSITVNPSEARGTFPGDSIACTSVEQRKPWYERGGDTQIWPLLEPQKSQQKNPALRQPLWLILTEVIDKHGGFRQNAGCLSLHASFFRP
jgi:hypothetical protein